MAKDANGLTALDIAEKSEHAECMRILKKAAGKRFKVIIIYDLQNSLFHTEKKILERNDL